MPKRVLMIAYHYPPVKGSSGVQRTLKFSSYLPQEGWDPIVLSVHPRAYEHSSPEQLSDIDPMVRVYRSLALDTARHLAIMGKYPRLLALPDRWISWWLSAVPVGMRLIRQWRPQLIWSTYPIATAHLIGITLHKLSGIPWVADFRDSMVDDTYPSDPITRRLYQRVENAAVHNATRAAFTTPGARDMYARRYPQLPAERWICIRNGYDEENFRHAEHTIAPLSRRARFELVHSGLLYPFERDPLPLFSALAELCQTGKLTPALLHITLRASGNEAAYQRKLDEFGIGDIVTLAPAIGYTEALAEMLQADGLLVLQAANCNHLIPAKLYEYLRARTPILALTDAAGETARLLEECGIDTVAPLDSKESIKTCLMDFLARIEAGTAPLAGPETIRLYSRRAQTTELAQLFDSLL